MKFAAVVLFNNKNPLSSVEFSPVTDALLAGGVFLDELVCVPYDNSPALDETLTRLCGACEGVFVIADDVLLSAAREAVAAVTGKPFADGQYYTTGERCLVALLPAGKGGAEIVERETVPEVDRRRGEMFSRVVLRTVGCPQENLKRVLAEAEEGARGKLVLHTSERYGVGRIELIYDDKTPKMCADEVVRILASGLSDWLYAMTDVTPAEQLVEALKLHRLKISTAESFTGGGVGRAIVRVPGASKVYFEGLNTYDSLSKLERLGVSDFTLRTKGAVSDETAYEMAAGLIKQGHCDVSIATTGVAGPEKDGWNPVGLCYLAVGTKERVSVFRYRLTGDRETITETGINLALFHALKVIR